MLTVDPDFDPLVLQDALRPPRFFVPSTSARAEAEEDVPPDGPLIGCTISGFRVSDPDRSFSWAQTWSPFSTTFNIKAALDAVHAAVPEAIYFTFSPDLNMGEEGRSIAACPDYGVGFGQNDIVFEDPTNPPGGSSGDVDQATWDLDGSPWELALYSLGAWRTGTLLEPAYDMGGVSNGITITPANAWFLRPTALTWDGQDPANTANRIFWSYDDIVTGDVLEQFSGGWGFLGGKFAVEIRAWLLAEPTPWMCVL